MRVAARSSEPARRGTYAVLLAVVLLPFVLLTGCAHRGPPRGWLPVAGASPPDPFGGWIEVEEVRPGPDAMKPLWARAAHGMPGAPSPTWQYRATLRGELIAVSADSLHVLSDSGLVSLAWSAVRRARLTEYDAQHGAFGAWTVAGVLSSFSHGVFLILSIPSWLIFGGVSTGIQANQAQVDFPRSEPETMVRYARFPSGLPSGLDRRHLEGRRFDAKARLESPPAPGMPGS